MLRTLIVDDEAPARKRLHKLLRPLEEDDRLEVVGEAEDGDEALALLKDQDVDLLLLDVQMPGKTGFDVVDQLAPEHRPVVVFTTAFDQYAVRAFEASAVDYLLKPIGRERLEEAIARAERLHRTAEQRQPDDGLDAERIGKLLDWLDEQATGEEPPAPERAEPPARQLTVQHRDRLLVVATERIVAAEIQEGITRLFVEEDPEPGAPSVAGIQLRQHLTGFTLDHLEERLDPDRFMRVHRSALVRLDAIEELIPWFSGRMKVQLRGGHEVIASRERAKLLRDRLSI